MARAVGRLHAIGGEAADLGGCGLAALRQFADLRSYHREVLSCSPARAASTAAFSASRSVFLAISSMILIFSATSFIACTVRATASPPVFVSSDDLEAILSVGRAWPGFWGMVGLI